MTGYHPQSLHNTHDDDGARLVKKQHRLDNHVFDDDNIDSHCLHLVAYIKTVIALSPITTTKMFTMQVIRIYHEATFLAMSQQNLMSVATTFIYCFRESQC